jgi:regulatory protein
MDTTGLQKILPKMRRYCAMQERCRKEVADKLAGYGLDRDDTLMVIEQLEKEKFLDESRFARHYAGSKLRLHQWGRLKIEAWLRQKDIPDNLISEGLNEIDEEDYLQLLTNLIKNSGQSRQKEDLFRYLTAKGFEPDLVSETMMIDIH